MSESSTAVLEGERRSLEEVNATVPVAYKKSHSAIICILGPAYLVSVGYMDPGNWATDLEGGALGLATP